MKIQWLGDNLDEAIVTRGILWWKRVAHVRDVGTSWAFVPSGDDVGSSLAYVMRSCKSSESGRRIVANRDRNWSKESEFVRGRSLPKARALR